MTTELYLIHVGFIAALVFGVFRSGVKHGEHELLQRLMRDAMIEAKKEEEFKTPL
tara:strand:- start:181 stop:345 length:165 start_codon:yes stop_codon:yes gene_type:complete